MDIHSQNTIRLNLGAGHKHVEGYLNVDLCDDPEPDIKSDVKKLALPDGYADEIMAIHLFEHLYRWEAPEALREWRRVLKLGGLLVLEMPDLAKCVRNIANDCNERLGIWGLFGDPGYKNPLMVHKWAWGERELKSVLRENGFNRVRFKPPQFHKKDRDLRVEAIAE